MFLRPLQATLLLEVQTERFDEMLPSWVPDWREKKPETVFSQQIAYWVRSNPLQLGVDVGLGLISTLNHGARSNAEHLKIHGFRLDELETLVDGEDHDAFLSILGGQQE